MESRVSIGAFAAASHLSVKTLRHYHEVGLLEPSEVDPNSGYRYYSYEQIPTAQVIRRLRALDMPVGELYLASGSGAARTALSSPTGMSRARSLRITWAVGICSYE
jgi:DNA-binding transcriptional MerR regulator